MKLWLGILTTLLSEQFVQELFSQIQSLLWRLHMQKPSIFSFWNIQNPSIIALQCIFRTLPYLWIGKPYVTMEPWRFRTLLYYQSWNTHNPDVFNTQHIFKIDCLIFKIGCFVKIVKWYNYFSKVLYLHLWQVSKYAHFSISTH